MATLTDAGLKSAVRAASAVVFFAAFTAGCDRQLPRTVNDFMDDPIARDGAIARCNQDSNASVNDPECVSARRAAAAIAVQEERERNAALAAESERKLRELRLQAERAEEAARLAAEEAAAKARAEYEAQYRADEDPAQQSAAASDAPSEPQPRVDAIAGPPILPQTVAPARNLLPSPTGGPTRELASDGARGEPPAAAEPGIIPRPFRGSPGGTP